MSKSCPNLSGSRTVIHGHYHPDILPSPVIYHCTIAPHKLGRVFTPSENFSGVIVAKFRKLSPSQRRGNCPTTKLFLTDRPVYCVNNGNIRNIGNDIFNDTLLSIYPSIYILCLPSWWIKIYIYIYIYIYVCVCVYLHYFKNSIQPNITIYKIVYGTVVKYKWLSMLRYTNCKLTISLQSAAQVLSREIECQSCSLLFRSTNI